MYGANCPKCAVGNPANVVPNPINYQHQSGNPKSGSWIRAFGRGIAGVFLFLFGLGMVFILHYHLTNLENSLAGMSYGVDPWPLIIMVLVIVPAILLSIGGTSIYYGIRIISKT